MAAHNAARVYVSVCHDGWTDGGEEETRARWYGTRDFLIQENNAKRWRNGGLVGTKQTFAPTKIGSIIWRVVFTSEAYYFKSIPTLIVNFTFILEINHSWFGIPCMNFL